MKTTGTVFHFTCDGPSELTPAIAKQLQKHGKPDQVYYGHALAVSKAAIERFSVLMMWEGKESS